MVWNILVSIPGCPTHISPMCGKHWQLLTHIERLFQSAHGLVGLQNRECVSWLRSIIQFSKFHSEWLPVTYQLLWNEHTCFGHFFSERGKKKKVVQEQRKHLNPFKFTGLFISGAKCVGCWAFWGPQASCCSVLPDSFCWQELNSQTPKNIESKHLVLFHLLSHLIFDKNANAHDYFTI